MYSYSPISAMRVKNFRNLGDVCVDFTESPIVALKGENEAGKTSFVKAFAVCGLHAYTKEQKTFIRDGTTGFGICIELEDGTLVTRIKSNDKNRYSVEYPNGAVWEADKLENDVPKAVSQVLGLIEETETKEFIQIRTYEDQLLFVVTAASTNYKVFYDALKISQLTRALKVGSLEVNELKAVMNTANSDILALRRSMQEMTTYDIEPLLNIRETMKRAITILGKMKSVVELKAKIERLKESSSILSAIDEYGISEIDQTIVDKLCNAKRTVDIVKSGREKLGSYSLLDGIETIDCSLMEKARLAIQKNRQLKEYKAKAGSYTEIVGLEPISVEVVQNIKLAKDLIEKKIKCEGIAKIYYGIDEASEIREQSLAEIRLLEKVIELQSGVCTKHNEISEIAVEIDKITSWMHSVGVSTIECPKCGESIVLDLAEIEAQN